MANRITSLPCLFLLNSMTLSAHMGVRTGDVSRNSPPGCQPFPSPDLAQEQQISPLLFMRQRISRNQDGSSRPYRSSLHCHGLLWSAMLTETCSTAKRNPVYLHYPVSPSLHVSVLEIVGTSILALCSSHPPQKWWCGLSPD